MNSATVAPKDDLDEISLEVIPTGNDRGVQTFMTEDLQGNLLLKQFNLSIRLVGNFLYIATLAMAQKSEQLIKVQNALLDNLKLNDTSAVMLQSFQSGAVNIVEKLKVAYLYLLDGFPEFAKTDVEAIGKDISTMESQAKKTKDSTDKCAKDVEAIKEQVQKKMKEVKNKRNEKVAIIEKNKKLQVRPTEPSYQSGGRPEENQLKTSSTCVCPCCECDCSVCCGCFFMLFPCFFPYSKPSGNSDNTAVAIREEVRTTGPERVPVNLDEEKEALKKLDDELRLFKLTFTVLTKASTILKECDRFLDQVLAVVKQWYTENKEVVAPSMEENIRRAEGMSETEMKEYWQSMMFKQEVQMFYTRWVALKVYCENTRKNLKEIRAETEAWYVDNPRPRDAVKKSWDEAAKVNDRDIDSIIEQHRQAT